MNIPVAVNCCVVPNAIDGLGGFTVMEARAATPIVSVVEAAIEFDEAEIFVFPVATLVARP